MEDSGIKPELSKLGQSGEGHEGRIVAHAADLALVQKALARDPEAVEALVERLYCVRRFLENRNRTHGRPLDSQELEDTLQSTLLAMWRKLDRYAGEGALEGWAYRFSFLEFLKRLQAIKRRPRTTAENPDAEPAPKKDAPDLHETEIVYRALERIGDQADIVRLKHFEELTFDQISERVGIPANTAKTRYYRALERLRKLMETSEFGGGEPA